MNLIDFACLNKPNFVPDWYHLLVANHLDRLAAGDPDVPNLLVSAPPGSGKTELVSIQFPASILAQDPSLHVIALANSDSLARMASSNVLRILRHPDVQEHFPIDFSRESEQTWTIEGNDGRPSLHAAGIGGQLTGHRADYLIADDLLKSQSESYSETIREKVWGNFQSAAETRLLPNGRIAAIMTRWHVADPLGQLLQRALDDPRARQFIYISLAAWNTGEDSFILDTRTGERTLLPKYKALAKVKAQPYSFSRTQLEGKRADLGASRWSALYMQNPVTMEDALFPPDSWKVYDSLNMSEISLLVSGWDCASKVGSSNDYSANVVVAKMLDGTFAVVDVWRDKLKFSELPALVMARYQNAMKKYNCQPLLVVEDANAGTQLLQVIEAQFPALPRIAAKPVNAKIQRAEGVTPWTRGGLVFLPRAAEWLELFISELANFPCGSAHDDIVDAFCHAMKCFISSGDFRPMRFALQAGEVVERDPVEALWEHAKYLNETAIGGNWDDDLFDGNWRGDW